VIDVNHHISAVERRVGTRNLPAGQVRVVTITRTFDAPVDEVWAACTDPARIPRWFLPVTGELRPGGRYQLEGNAGGVIERCYPPGDAGAGFVATWEYGGDVSGIEVRLRPGPGGGTVLTLDHVGHVDDAFWEEFGPGAVGVGWELGLLGLAGHLGAAGVPTPDRSASWSASAEGRTFMVRCSEEWGAAHAASGADLAAAHAAAARTAAAYTASGEPSGETSGETADDAAHPAADGLPDCAR
jgi:uncharacterized protein YndB with AHSA1/START domain